MKNQRGIAPIILVGIIAALIIGFLIVLYISFNTPSEKTNKQTFTPKNASNESIASCKDLDYGGCDEGQEHFQWVDDGLD